jgi:hypothetical protein
MTLVPLIDVGSPSPGYPPDTGTVSTATQLLGGHDTDGKNHENLCENPHVFCRPATFLTGRKRSAYQQQSVTYRVGVVLRLRCERRSSRDG